MKRLNILLLGLFLSFFCEMKGQEVRAVFDFSDISTLLPSMAFDDKAISPDEIFIHDSIFYDKSIQLSFRHPTNGATTKVSRSGGPVVLMCYRFSEMVFESLNGEVIKDIAFYSSALGGFGLLNDQYPEQYGIFGLDTDEHCGRWTPAAGVDLSKIEFANSGAASRIDKIVVTYVPKSSNLMLFSQSMGENAILDSFRKLETVYADDIKLASNTAISLVRHDVVDVEGETVVNDVSVDIKRVINGHKLTVYSDTVITKAGDYTLTIPAGAVMSKDGYLKTDAPFVLNFNIKDTSTPPTVDPGDDPGIDPGEQEDPEISGGVKLDYKLVPEENALGELKELVLEYVSTDVVTLKDASLISINDTQGVPVPKLTVEAKADTVNTFIIKARNVLAGEYKLTVCTGAFVVSQLEEGIEKVNDVAGFTRDYTVWVGANPQTDFIEPRESFYYQISGGKSDDKTYREDLNDYVFYIPSWKTKGVWLNPNAKVTIEYAFTSEVFATGTLEKVAIKGETAKFAFRIKFKETFGEDCGPITNSDLHVDPNFCETYRFRIFEGAFGDENYGKYLANPASIDLADCHVNEESYIIFGLYKKGTSTPGGDDPHTPGEEDPQTFEADFDLAQSGVDTNNYIEDIVLTFPELDGVTYNAAKEITLTAGATVVKAKAVSKPETITTGEGDDAKTGTRFTISFLNVVAGTYTLNIPAGAFVAGEDKVQAITGSYTAKKTPTVEVDSSSKWWVISAAKKPGENLVNIKTITENADIQDAGIINNLIIQNDVWNKNDDVSLHLISGKKVRLMCGETEVATGHLADYNENIVNNRYSAFRIDFDKEITEEIAKPGAYELVIEAGFIGNDEYFKYIQDEENTSKINAKTVGELKLKFTISEYKAEPEFATINGSVEGTVDGVKISFPTAKEVKLADNAKGSLTAEDGTFVGSVTFAAVTGKANVFEARFINLDAGKYTLSAPENTFVADGHKLPAISYEFTVTKSYEIAVDSESKWQANVGTDGCLAGMLNSLGVFSNDWKYDYYVDGTKVVALMSGDKTVATGHLETVENSTVINVVFDKLITEDDVQPGDYTLVIPEGAIGNSKYGEYVAAPTAVSKGECVISGAISLAIKVNSFDAGETFGVIDGIAQGTVDGWRIEFTKAKAVSLADGAEITLTDKDGEVIKPVAVEPTAGKANAYDIRFINLDAGTYTLNIPEHAFVADGHKLAALTQSFTVEKGHEITVDNSTWTALIEGSAIKAEGYWAESLNDVVFSNAKWSANSYINEDKAVNLMRGNDVVATGRLVADKAGAFKLVFNPALTEDVVPAGNYTIVVPEGAIGNGKYGEYLANPAAVSKSECEMNAEFSVSVKINLFDATHEILAVSGAQKGTVEWITVVFPQAEKVVLDANAQVVLVADGGAITAPIAVEPTDGKQNSYDFHFINLEKGTYTLNVPDNAFELDGRKLKGFTEQIKVASSPVYVADLVETWSALIGDVVREGNGDEPEYHALDLNNVVFYSDDMADAKYVDPNKRVILTDGDDKELATGVLVATSVPVGEGDNVEYVPAYRLVFERVFRDGDIKVSRAEGDDGCAYKIVIPEGMIGDSNYADYMVGKAVSKSDCHVNAEFVFDMDIFPAIPTAVDGVNADAQSKVSGIVDLSGRPVRQPSTRGVYVVDGKKVYLKK